MPGPALSLEALEKTYVSRTRVAALRSCSLTVGGGECVAILGPSGCGKTTLLRTVAGLETPDAGRVCFDGRDVTRVPVERRNVGFVFQSDALFARASVYENIAFGLRARRVDARTIDARVRAFARRIRADAFLERPARTLSGGERQRVAIARALATEPAVLLLDEPLSRLDTPLRAELRRELAGIVRQRDATVLYVTHDQSEALTLGDRIAVMRDGAIVQIGTARELYDRPVDRFVAAALGTPAIAFVPATFAFADAGAGEVCGVRAAAVRLSAEGSLRGTVRLVEDFVDATYVYVDGPFGSLVARAGDALPAIGEHVGLEIDRAQVVCFDASGRRIERRVHA